MLLPIASGALEAIWMNGECFDLMRRRNRGIKEMCRSNYIFDLRPALLKQENNPCFKVGVCREPMFAADNLAGRSHPMSFLPYSV
jgi:hypothetical protein